MRLFLTVYAISRCVITDNCRRVKSKHKSHRRHTRTCRDMLENIVYVNSFLPLKIKKGNFKSNLKRESVKERAQLKSVTKVLIERAMSVTGSQAK